MGKYGSVSVGRSNDRRWKLSPKDIVEIKRMRRSGMIVRQIATIYGINPGTVNYWTCSKLRAYMRAKNAKRKRNQAEEREQYVTNKIRRRNLVRDKVRVYTRKQMKSWRKDNIDHVRKQGAEYARKRRLIPENKARQNESQRLYWRKKVGFPKELLNSPIKFSRSRKPRANQ